MKLVKMTEKEMKNRKGGCIEIEKRDFTSTDRSSVPSLPSLRDIIRQLGIWH